MAFTLIFHVKAAKGDSRTVVEITQAEALGMAQHYAWGRVNDGAWADERWTLVAIVDGEPSYAIGYGRGQGIDFIGSSNNL